MLACCKSTAASYLFLYSLSIFLFTKKTMSKTIYVELAVKIDDDANCFEVIENCDYTLDGDGILSHEIIGVTDENDRLFF